MNECPAPNSRWFRFGLPTMFVVVTVLGVFVAPAIHHAGLQKRVVDEVESNGGRAWYDYQRVSRDDPNDQYFTDPQPPSTQWPWSAVDKDLLFNVECVEIAKDADDQTLQRISQLPRMKRLGVLSSRKVTDRGLAYLGGLRNLEVVGFRETSITKEAAEKFKLDHPNVQIDWLPPDE